MRKLIVGLRQNQNIDQLSLNNCGLTEQSSINLLELLIFKDSKIKELYLEGNFLTQKGAAIIFKAMKLNRTLVKLDLSDNVIEENEEFIESFIQFIEFQKNPVENLNLSKNNINMATCNRLSAALLKKEDHNFQSITLPEKIDKDVANRISDMMKAKNKKKKSKKSKG